MSAERLDLLRLSMAVFEEHEALSSVVAQLLDAGLDCDQLCLIARKSTLIRLDRLALPQTAASGSADKRRDGVERWPDCVDKDEVTATSGPLLDLLLFERATPHRPVDTVGRLLAEIDPAALLGQSRADAVVLLVKSATPKQQSTTTRVLLNESRHRVKSLELPISRSRLAHAEARP